MSVKQISLRLTTFFASPGFFWAIIVFFFVEALWIALSAVYPLPFDEDFHFGLIKLYSTHWSPFLTSQPPNADAFGAVARDPSYLYHYLMSFPYRLLTHIVSNQTTQIIVLRVMNIALFTGSLYLFRKLLLRLTRSGAFTNITLAIFVLIPIVPQLAAHINYDNLLMVLVAWVCLLVTDVHQQFAAGRLRVQTLLTLLALSLIASIVKYSFLPIFGAVVVFVVCDAWVSFRNLPRLWTAIVNSWRTLSTKARWVSVLFVLLASVLFFQRFGVNTIKYHTPVPECGQVLSVDHCSAYGPWDRDYQNIQQKSFDLDVNPIKYTYQWLRGLWWRLFFAINSSTRNYTNYPPLPFPSTTAVVLAIVMGLLIIIFARRIFTRPLLTFCGLVVFFYCGALWLDNYKMFAETGQPVAINGRYLIPVLPLIAAVAWRGFNLIARRLNQVWLKPALASVVLLLFLQGGGLITFIMRSDESWYWSNNTVIKVNNTARSVLDPFIIQGSKQTKAVL
ncbi:MAG: hypothetical protein ACQR33_00275 [Candidatus Saccharibacteria bacterium]